ncbi:MAG: peptidoglycan DD-metalloendopeptidase family protein [Bacillota bacterium]
MKLSRRNRRRIFFAVVLSAFSTALWWGWPRQPAPAPTETAQTEEPPAAVTSAAPEVAEPVAELAESKPEQAPAAAKAEPPAKVQVYRVAAGDTAEAIAARFGLKTTTVLWSNRLTESSVLQIDQELLIPATDGVIHNVSDGDTFWDIAAVYNVEVDALILANPDISPDALQPGQKMLVPNGTPPRRSTTVASRSGGEGSRPAVVPPSGGLSLIWPLSGELTERFGWRTHPVYGTPNYHEGIDIGIPEGTPIVAVAAGRVITAEWYGGYGLTVRIDHGNGLVSRYSHDSKLLVKVGEWVEAGQVIALSGNTGVSTGPHLDFGLYSNGQPFDPLTMLP